MIAAFQAQPHVISCRNSFLKPTTDAPSVGLSWLRQHVRNFAAPCNRSKVIPYKLACTPRVRFCVNAISEGLQGKSPAVSSNAQTSVLPITLDKASPAPTAGENAWNAFLENVTGEWDGYTANFNSKGQPLELPYSVVPSAFRDWDIKLFDWRTQCLVRPGPQAVDSNPSIQCELRYLNPTVGCEADAATLHKSVTSRLPLDRAPGMQSLLASHPEGSYCCLPLSVPPAWLLTAGTSAGSTASSLALEVCLAQDAGYRTRIWLSVTSDGAGVGTSEVESGPNYCVGARWKLSNVTVSREEKVGALADAATLPGCGSQRRANEFAAGAPVSLDDVNQGPGSADRGTSTEPTTLFRATSPGPHAVASQWAQAGGHVVIGPAGSPIGTPGQLSPPHGSSGASHEARGFRGIIYGTGSAVVGKEGERYPFQGSYVALPGGVVVAVSGGPHGQLHIETAWVAGKGKRVAWRCTYRALEHGGMLQVAELAEH